MPIDVNRPMQHLVGETGMQLLEGVGGAKFGTQPCSTPSRPNIRKSSSLCGTAICEGYPPPNNGIGLLGSRTLLEAPGLTTSNKDATNGAPGIATSRSPSKDNSRSLGAVSGGHTWLIDGRKDKARDEANMAAMGSNLNEATEHHRKLPSEKTEIALSNRRDRTSFMTQTKHH